MKRNYRTMMAWAAVFALALSACTQEAEPETTTAPDVTVTTAAPAPETTEAPTETTMAEEMAIATDIGVTEEPCPDGNPDRGCIYLGVLTDESGPFQAASPALYGAQQLFWGTVNAGDGIGGAYDVAVPEDLKKDTAYDPAKFVADYNQIAGDVAAIAQSLGTSQSLAAIADYERDHTVAAPMSWWSGWSFEDNIIEFGTNYCFESMNAIDWAAGAFPAQGRELNTIGILFIPNDYGLDYSAGVNIAAAANDIEVIWELPVIPASSGGDPTQTEAVAKVVGETPDLVILVTGPSETAAIVGGAAQILAADVPLFIGASPSWNTALLASAAAPAFESGIFFNSAFVEGWDTDSVGHEKMRAAVGSIGADPNEFWISGWVSQYGLKAVLDDAYAAGDLTKVGIETAALALGDVDYEGMMPARSFDGEPNDIFPRDAIISGYSADATTGMATIQDFFVGPTAAAHDFTEACAG